VPLFSRYIEECPRFQKIIFIITQKTTPQNNIFFTLYEGVQIIKYFTLSERQENIFYPTAKPLNKTAQNSRFTEGADAFRKIILKVSQKHPYKSLNFSRYIGGSKHQIFHAV